MMLQRKMIIFGRTSLSQNNNITIEDIENNIDKPELLGIKY